MSQQHRPPLQVERLEDRTTPAGLGFSQAQVPLPAAVPIIVPSGNHPALTLPPASQKGISIATPKVNETPALEKSPVFANQNSFLPADNSQNSDHGQPDHATGIANAAEHNADSQAPVHSPVFGGGNQDHPTGLANAAEHNAGSQAPEHSPNFSPTTSTNSTHQVEGDGNGDNGTDSGPRGLENAALHNADSQAPNHSPNFGADKGDDRPRGLENAALHNADSQAPNHSPNFSNDSSSPDTTTEPAAELQQSEEASHPRGLERAAENNASSKASEHSPNFGADVDSPRGVENAAAHNGDSQAGDHSPNFSNGAASVTEDAALRGVANAAVNNADSKASEHSPVFADDSSTPPRGIVNAAIHNAESQAPDHSPNFQTEQSDSDAEETTEGVEGPASDSIQAIAANWNGDDFSSELATALVLAGAVLQPKRDRKKPKRQIQSRRGR